MFHQGLDELHRFCCLILLKENIEEKNMDHWIANLPTNYSAMACEIKVIIILLNTVVYFSSDGMVLDSVEQDDWSSVGFIPFLSSK